MAINGTAIAVASVGGLLLYSAVKNTGIGDTARSLLSGKSVASDSGVSGAAALQNLLVNPSLGDTTAPVSGGGAAAINSYLKTTMKFSRAQRAGILGNMQIESNFNPSALNAPAGAIGICQWEGGRRTALQKFAAAAGRAETDLVAQLGYFHTEMNTAFVGVQAMIRASNNPATVASIFDSSYERSAGTSRQARISAAESLYASDVTA